MLIDRTPSNQDIEKWELMLLMLVLTDSPEWMIREKEQRIAEMKRSDPEYALLSIAEYTAAGSVA